MCKKFMQDDSGSYVVSTKVSEDDIVSQAQIILAGRMERLTDALTSPDVVRDFLKIQIGGAEAEQFMVVFLDNRHRVIAAEVMFTGTIDSAAVYPREIVKRSLALNAAALLLAHNHPSGMAVPSDTDIRLTRKLVDALSLVDIRVLDHMIVTPTDITSLAEQGQM